jgi:hypothetical protein
MDRHIYEVKEKMVMVILIAVHKYKLGPCISNKHFASAEY